MAVLVRRAIPVKLKLPVTSALAAIFARPPT